MAASSTAFINSAEAAFIAEVSDRDFNRVIDEHIVPDSLVQLDSGRRVARLAAAFISFYVGTESVLTAQLRKRVLSTITGRVNATDKWTSVLGLVFTAPDSETRNLFRFTSENPAVLTLDISNFVEQASARARMVDRALEHVSVDASVLGGVPVFKGTRVPIESVLASLDAGVDLRRLRDSYEFLTQELVDAARIFAAVRPRRGRPRRLAERNSTLKLESSKVVRSSSSAT